MSLMIVWLCSGPQPGWDPDIVAALEAAETSNTLEEDELEDDFVTMVRLFLYLVFNSILFFFCLLRLMVVRLDYQFMSQNT